MDPLLETKSKAEKKKEMIFQAMAQREEERKAKIHTETKQVSTLGPELHALAGTVTEYEESGDKQQLDQFMSGWMEKLGLLKDGLNQQQSQLALSSYEVELYRKQIEGLEDRLKSLRVAATKKKFTFSKSKTKTKEPTASPISLKPENKPEPEPELLKRDIVYADLANTTITVPPCTEAVPLHLTNLTECQVRLEGVALSAVRLFNCKGVHIYFDLAIPGSVYVDSCQECVLHQLPTCQLRAFNSTQITVSLYVTSHPTIEKCTHFSVSAFDGGSQKLDDLFQGKVPDNLYKHVQDFDSPMGQSANWVAS